MSNISGICKNIDEECSKALQREIQEVEKSAPFICEECGKQLVPATGKSTKRKDGTKLPPNKNRLILIVILAVAVLAGCGVGIYFFLFNIQTPKIKDLTVTPAQLELTVGDKNQLSYSAVPVDAPAEGLLWSSSDEAVASVSDGTVTALAAGEAQITLSTPDLKVSAKCVVKVNEPVEEPTTEDVAAALNSGVVQGDANGVGRISTPLGNYNGDLKNGKADGNGTFEFFKPGLISSKDPMGRVSETGDFIAGQFANNEVVNVTWLNDQKKQKDVIIVGSGGIPNSPSDKQTP
jgi:hypothetical protein